MENEFVTYEQAVKLKELGFDKSCFDGFMETTCGVKLKSEHNLCTVVTEKGKELPAPLKQQVFRWLRDEHRIFASIETDCTSYPKFAIVINAFVGNPRDLTEKEWHWVNISHFDLYRSYEEAESDCIDKLITFIEAKSFTNFHLEK
jgi:hypothetical protein